MVLRAQRGDDLSTHCTGGALSASAAARRGLTLCLLALSACAGPPLPVHRGPIVLITIDTLRADVVGGLGGDSRLTPHLDALIEEASWAGRAITTSSWTVPSMASIFTGLQPWRHGSWHDGRAALRPELETLPEALSALGYETSGFRSNRWLTAKFGYDQGFASLGSFGRSGRLGRLKELLNGLDGGPQFVWVHILPPHAPYVYREHLVARLDSPRQDLPKRILPQDLGPYFDPAVELPQEMLEKAWQMYQLNVAWSDERVGEVLRELRASGQWGSALIIVTSDHGEEFGENGQVVHGGSLHRVLIEVPLIVKLPSHLDLPALDPGPVVANHRLWATLVELAGGEVSVDKAPSLFRYTEEPALSELYRGNGVNLFSIVDGSEQLIWRSRFAEPEPEYYKAHLAQLGLPVAGGLSEEPAEVFARLGRLFASVPVLRGVPGVEPVLEVWEWRHDGTTEPASAEVAFGRRLQSVWDDLNGPDGVPSDVARGRGGECPS